MFTVAAFKIVKIRLYVWNRDRAHVSNMWNTEFEHSGKASEAKNMKVLKLSSIGQ